MGLVGSPTIRPLSVGAESGTLNSAPVVSQSARHSAGPQGPHTVGMLTPTAVYVCVYILRCAGSMYSGHAVEASRTSPPCSVTMQHDNHRLYSAHRSTICHRVTWNSQASLCPLGSPLQARNFGSDLGGGEGGGGRERVRKRQLQVVLGSASPPLIIFAGAKGPLAAQDSRVRAS